MIRRPPRSTLFPSTPLSRSWLGELEADSTLESDYIFYLHVLGKADPGRIAKLANYIRRKQLPEGGWNIYPRSEEHTSELQSRPHLVCRLLLEKKKTKHAKKI